MGLSAAISALSAPFHGLSAQDLALRDADIGVSATILDPSATDIGLPDADLGVSAALIGVSGAILAE